MSLPSITKTWQYNVNQAIGGTGTASTDNQMTWRTLKNTLKGFSTLPWAVRYSCNGTTAGTAGDGVDRWAANSDVVFSSAPTNSHSWMVLRQTGLGGGSGCELLIDCGVNNSNGTLVRLSISPAAGFTGGTTTASPTATDQFWLVNGGGSGASATDASWGGEASAWSGKLHVWQSSDGQVTRAVVCLAGYMVGFFSVEKPTGAPASWVNPVVGAMHGTASAATDMSTYPQFFRSPGKLNGRLGTGPQWCALFPSTECVNQTELGVAQSFPNDVDGTYPMSPVGVYCLSGTGARGRQGALFDIWAGSTAVASGSTYPNDTSRQFAQIGVLIFPWGGQATPQIS